MGLVPFYPNGVCRECLSTARCNFALNHLKYYTNLSKEREGAGREGRSHVPILTLCAPSSMQDLSSQIGSLTTQSLNSTQLARRTPATTRRTISSLQPSMLLLLPLTFSTLSQQSLPLTANERSRARTSSCPTAQMTGRALVCTLILAIFSSSCNNTFWCNGRRLCLRFLALQEKPFHRDHIYYIVHFCFVFWGKYLSL